MNTNTKIVKLPTLEKRVARLRGQGCKIVFTNGCFDILHRGHVSYLQQAKKTGRVLIVGINSDRSVKKIKGPKRPVMGERSRADVLAALACVDYVTLFHEETPLRVIKALKPDILVKGADWKGKDVAGSDFVRANGGRIEYIKYISGFSSTGIIKRIVKSAKTRR